MGKPADGSGSNGIAEGPEAVRSVHGLVDGRVQGVGFRWFVTRRARALRIDGDVRNLADGRVEFRGRGRGADIESWLQEIRRGPEGSLVRELELKDLVSEARFDGFEIRR